MEQVIEADGKVDEGVERELVSAAGHLCQHLWVETPAKHGFQGHFIPSSAPLPSGNPGLRSGVAPQSPFPQVSDRACAETGLFQHFASE